jgi:hypothetical protein
MFLANLLNIGRFIFFILALNDGKYNMLGDGPPSLVTKKEMFFSFDEN